MDITTPESGTSQNRSEKLNQAARELGCDEGEVRWDERLRKVARHKPAGLQ